MIGKGIDMWYKVIALILVLALMVPILAACDDEDTPTVAITETTKPTATTEPTKTTPDSKGPVKIGVLGGWSGVNAIMGVGIIDPVIAVIEHQVKEMGGILDGRPIEFIRQDSKGTVSGTTAGFEKLVSDEKVCAVALGGVTASSVSTSSDAAEKFKVPLFAVGPNPFTIADRPFTVRAGVPHQRNYRYLTADFILDYLKPDTVALLIDDVAEHHDAVALLKEKLLPAGVDIVYEQYIPSTTADYAPFVTKIKYADPDVTLHSHAVPTAYMGVFKQIAALGGWEGMDFVSAEITSSDDNVIRLGGAEGTYHWVLWIPGMDNPAAKKFEQDFMAKNGRMPTSLNFVMYLTIWNTVHAIELAGTDDPLEIAKAAKSGELQWDSPAGLFTIDTDGESNLTGFIAQVVDHKLVPVYGME